MVVFFCPRKAIRFSPSDMMAGILWPDGQEQMELASVGSKHRQKEERKVGAP